MSFIIYLKKLSIINSTVEEVKHTKMNPVSYKSSSSQIPIFKNWRILNVVYRFNKDGKVPISE